MISPVIKILFLLLVFFVLPCNVHGQNLVPNGDFESYVHCPSANDNLKSLKNWTIPNWSTPDYFRCSLSDPLFKYVGVPDNSFGHQQPRSGVAYAGAILLTGTWDVYHRYSEYMQIELISALEAGVAYYCEMYVSHAERTRFAINNIGMYISEDAINLTGYDTNFNYTPQVMSGGFVTEEDGWEKISGIYTARGGERYLTIGRFGTPSAASAQVFRPASGHLYQAYYYIDDVSLRRLCNIRQPLLPADASLCAGDTMVLDPGPFMSYHWNDGSKTRQYMAAQTGTYAVTVTDAFRCTASDSIRVIVHPNPVVKLPQKLFMCDPDTLVLAESDPLNDYLWSDGTSLPTNRITSYGTYTVTVIDSNDCSHSDTMIVINTCKGHIYVPNVFTPGNGDNLNDLFRAVTRNMRSIHMQVYTRWGELVFETTDLNEAWDGMYRTSPAPQDVYVYKISYTDIQGTTGELTGNVTLLR